jgi:hypothetical protein
LDDDARKLALTQGRRMIEPARAAPTIQRYEYVAIEADEGQQQ